MTEKRFDVVYEEDDEYKNIRYWEIKDKKYGATTSNELKICHLLNNLNDENEQLKDALNQRTDQCDKYYKENEQLKQDMFICLDCKYSGYIEIGCLCEKKDHWTDYKTECEDYEELKE